MEHKNHFGKKRGETTRACSRCGGDLGTRYKKQRYCKDCHAANMRATRPTHEELTVEQRQRSNSRSLARYYLNKGIIKKEECQGCGNPNSQMHHEDYSKPLEVIWLCRECHLDLHFNRNNMTDNNTKRPLKWFEDRVGQFIFRAPFFQSEQGKPHIAMKIKDKAHALLLFDLQRAGRPPYEDKPESFTMTSTRSR